MQLRCRRNEIGEDPLHLTMLQPATVVMRSYGLSLCVDPTTFGCLFRSLTVPETNIAPETLGLEDEFSFGKASWQVLC